MILNPKMPENQNPVEKLWRERISFR